jgi:biotin carboxylase
MPLAPQFFILDEREVWHRAACEAAERAGYQAKRVFSGERFNDAKPGDVGFIRPHADWRKLPANRVDYAKMHAADLTMVQDWAQVEVYENKTEQAYRWCDWMPDTWCFNEHDMAQAHVAQCDYPLVSKADVGASSTNIRILKDKDEAAKHIARLFGDGIRVHHGANCPQTMQKGYALLQRFIPHKITYRVNAVGDSRAVFFRRCYPDKPVAQTGNTDAAYAMTPELESLLEYSDRVLADIGSKWCALDVLKDVDGSWKLLETSLAWPWQADAYADATMFRSTKGRKWAEIFDCMFDELEAGAWKQ